MNGFFDEEAENILWKVLSKQKKTII